MKKAAICFMILLSTFFLSNSVFSQDVKSVEKTKTDATVSYKDGTYEGMSRAKYVYEPFWGKARLTVKDGAVTYISFVIRDSNLHETFDGNYEKHFIGNNEYIQQSRNDWKGVQNYTNKLSEKKDINKVDAVSGATWSYNIFKASVNEALKNAK
jgi:major membrane immunogen (membrane-anchored lipoprotein)